MPKELQAELKMLHSSPEVSWHVPMSRQAGLADDPTFPQANFGRGPGGSCTVPRMESQATASHTHAATSPTFRSAADHLVLPQSL